MTSTAPPSRASARLQKSRPPRAPSRRLASFALGSVACTALVPNSEMWFRFMPSGRTEKGAAVMCVFGPVVSRAALGLALAAGISVAQAEDFPARPVKIIVQTAAGSSLDVMARLVAEPLSQMWGQQAIIVNQAGAGGLIASRALAASPADGYTL